MPALKPTGAPFKNTDEGGPSRFEGASVGMRTPVGLRRSCQFGIGPCQSEGGVPVGLDRDLCPLLPGFATAA